MNLINKIFGTRSQRELKRIEPIIQKIEGLRDSMMSLSDEELKDKTREYKERYVAGETLDELLPEAFATVREAGRRVLQMEHFRVQLIGGIILHQGRIAEMRTGEGKTLVSTLPAYLNALTGEGVHIVTVNDYLASRDAEWMGAIHRFLGLSVGCVLNHMESEERRAAYACDITYITNNELGFDYLRDNMVVYKENLVQRSLHYAIVDEVDSVLIDEARTPLIISGQSGKSTDLYRVCNYLATRLERGEASGEINKMTAIMGEEIIETGDFIVNEKDKVINLTEEGVKKVEDYFHLDNLADPENLEIQHNMILALRAHNLMFKDQDYVVKDGEIVIVDSFTGRMMPGRRYSDGLHQAIEAKENVEIKRESKTLATITFQNFFNKYEKKAGMTGTAMTEEQEFRDIYNMDVVEIPTNKPVQRIDYDDAVYTTRKGKYKAVVDEIERTSLAGQPVLVGTVTIETSELISSMLKKRGIPHKVLNAKYHEQEAAIVEDAGTQFLSDRGEYINEAGQKVCGTVTIATNMAGRGTDIKLEEGAKAAGGLKIIGTERHESRRIDNQLRGRAGRQGDPGESKFYLSLEDDLMRLFGQDRMMKVFTSLGISEDEEIQHKMLSNAIETAQKRIEGNNYGIRKNLLDYDRVANEQREEIYRERRRVLDGEDMRQSILNMTRAVIDRTVGAVVSEEVSPREWSTKAINTAIFPIIPIPKVRKEDLESMNNVDDLVEFIYQEALKIYVEKEKEVPDSSVIRELERVVLLKVVDAKWMDHIDYMDSLKESIGLASYGQKDPLVEYRMQAYDAFGQMSESIQEDTIRMLFHVRLERKMEREEVAQPTSTNKDDTSIRKPEKRKEEKVMPNDNCPCGSGKKYKHCCGRK